MTEKPQTNTRENQQKKRQLKPWIKPELTELSVGATQGGADPKRNENHRHHVSF